MQNHNWIFWFLSFFVASTAQADSDYRCTIQRVSIADNEPNPTLKLYEKNYIGKQFSVERKSGIMTGILKNSYVTLPQIIDFGSKDNSFKVITTMRLEEGAGSGSNIYALTINEYDESPKKPFVYLNNNDVVFFGSCEHF